MESGGEDQIAMWMLDTDYDGRSLYPRQVFLPDVWITVTAGNRLARNLKAEIDEELIEAYRWDGLTGRSMMGEHQQGCRQDNRMIGASRVCA